VLLIIILNSAYVVSGFFFQPTDTLPAGQADRKVLNVELVVRLYMADKSCFCHKIAPSLRVIWTDYCMATYTSTTIAGKRFCFNKPPTEAALTSIVVES